MKKQRYGGNRSGKREEIRKANLDPWWTPERIKFLGEKLLESEVSRVAKNCSEAGFMFKGVRGRWTNKGIEITLE